MLLATRSASSALTCRLLAKLPITTLLDCLERHRRVLERNAAAAYNFTLLKLTTQSDRAEKAESQRSYASWSAPSFCSNPTVYSGDWQGRSSAALRKKG